jgi:2-keto-4-pentenoate hydratase/2-oxohepta-3-ene-1,7-dioic acid hydratase in catechol pathway
MAYPLYFTDGLQFSHTLGKIVCVGRNYAEHAKELNNPIPTEPILFIKPESSAVSLNSDLVIPSSDCHYETEIAILIGSSLKSANEVEVEAAIAGVGLGLDLTRRALQSKLKEKSHPWEVAKSFDGACPLTNFAKSDQFSDLTNLQFSLHVNDALKQSGNSEDMLNPIVPLIAHMSKYFTLKPGDIVLTGTPKGVGELRSGDLLKLSLMDKIKVTTQVV